MAEKELWKNNLKELRAKHNLTQQQVATLLGFKSHNRICRWEKGQLVPHMKNLIKLSQVYQVSVEALFNPGKT